MTGATGMPGTRDGLWKMLRDYDWYPEEELFEAVRAYVGGNPAADPFVAEAIVPAYRAGRGKRVLAEMGLTEDSLTRDQGLGVWSRVTESLYPESGPEREEGAMRRPSGV